MNSAADRSPDKKNNPFLSWEFIAIKLMVVLFIGVLLQKPAGSLAGRIALEQQGFNLFSYNMRQHHVFALAIGPHGSASQERGVWVNKDGTFRIDNLPVGEYELKVKLPGFATSYDSGIFVEDGRTTNLNHPVQLALEHPSINISSNTRVFTTREQPRFWTNAEYCNEANVSVYKADLLSWATASDGVKERGFEITPALTCYKPYDAKSQDVVKHYFAKMQPVRTWKRQLEGDESHQQFKFEKPLPQGDYIAIVEGTNVQGESDWNVLSFTVTDLGLVVKQDPWQTLVRAIDLNTLRPVQNAQVRLISRSGGGAIGSGATGSDGFVTIKAPSKFKDGTDIIVAGVNGDNHAYGGMNYYAGGSSDKYRTMFYTDRPVYRLGQTVYFKGLCRVNDVEGNKNPGANVKIAATIEDPDNNEIWHGNLKTNEHGTFSGLYELPADGKTGAYQITFKYPDGSDSSERFEIAEYRKPEYSVEVTPLSPRITLGDKLRARVKAAYYFGAPVANARVKYTIFSGVDWSTRYTLMDRPEYYGYFNGWDDDEGGGGDDAFAGDYISQGYTVTDSNGEATVEFDTKKVPFDFDKPWTYDRYDHRYKVEAEVTDISRLAVIGSGSCEVTNGDYALFVSPSTYVASVGDAIGADVRAVGYDSHQPIANAHCHVRLYRRLYDRNRYEYKGVEILDDADVVTDAQGKAHVSFKTKPQFPTDTYEILATSADRNQNIIADESSIWVVSSASPYLLPDSEAAKEPLVVKLDKKVYKVGETAKVMITAPVTGAEGAQAIVTIEGPKVYKYQVVDMKATGEMVEVPIAAEYAPDVFVDVVFIGKKHQYYEHSEMIKVSPEDHFLKLAIESDKQKYKPGEVATYTIKATFPNGKPAPQTEVSLGVVDESIYAIRPDTTPDIRTFFYPRRYDAVTTICSFPEDYSGGPNKIEPRVRKDFKDTAVWVPALTTDANGIAKTSVKLPDNLTTWRATAVAINMGTDVAEARQKIISTQDLILRLALPRFFSQGDHGVITAVVHNFTDRQQPVELDLDASNQFKVNAKLHQRLVIDPDKAQRFSWPVDVVDAGEAVVRCKAVGATAGDAMETKLPIRTLGVESFVARSGVSNADDISVNIPAQVPADAVPGSARLDVYLSCSSIGSLVGNFGSLIDYPYGCTEQTMSKLMPSVVAVRLNQTMHVPLSFADKDRFKLVYKKSMDKLNDYQHDDGGWGWWKNDNSQVYLTSLVLDGYKLLQDAGYSIPADRQQNGLGWLRKNADALVVQLNDPMIVKQKYLDADEAIDLSRAAYVFTRYKQPISPALRSWALAHINQMTPESLSYFTMAFAGAKDSETAHSFYNRLLDLANTTTGDGGSTIDWSPSTAMLRKLGRTQTSYYSYRYTDVETTALALEAIATMEPDSFDRLESVKRWILLQRDKNGWDNTKTTAEVLRSFMLAETSAGKDIADTDFKVSIDANGVQPLAFTQSNMFDKEKDVVIVPKSAGTYTLHKQGHGRLYYTSILTYNKRIQPGEYVADKSMPDGLKLRREFFRLKPSAPDSNGQVHFSAEPLTDKTVHAGETILMKVYVEAPVSLPYVIMEAPLPSGAEVVENDSRENAQEANSDSNKNDDTMYNFGDWWWTHQDVMDDHLAFFVTNFPRGKAELHQMIRMEIPGKFEMNPITLQGMYTKGVRAYSQADEIQVVE